MYSLSLYVGSLEDMKSGTMQPPGFQAAPAWKGQKKVDRRSASAVSEGLLRIWRFTARLPTLRASSSPSSFRRRFGLVLNLILLAHIPGRLTGEPILAPPARIVGNLRQDLLVGPARKDLDNPPRPD